MNVKKVIVSEYGTLDSFMEDPGVVVFSYQPAEKRGKK
jgi:hypothetical protein